MKVTYVSGNGNFKLEVEGDQLAVWRELASFQEVFEEEACGKCQSSDIRFAVRSVQDGKKTHEYYEMRCNACGARLAFGRHQDSPTLFPKRSEVDRGWLRWDPEAKKLV